MKPGWVRSLLIIALAVLFPFERTMAGMNVSLGDAVVVLIGGLLVLKIAASGIALPRYVAHAALLIAIIIVSMTVNMLFPPGAFFELRNSQIEAIKIVASVAWMVAICWLCVDDFAGGFRLFTVASLLVAAGFAVVTVYENLFQHLERPTGPFENPNIYGNFLMLNVFLAAGLVSSPTAPRTEADQGWREPSGTTWWPLLLVTLPILLVGIMATGSRGTLLGLTVGVAVAARWRLPRRIGVGQVAVALLGVLAVIAAAVWFLDQHPYLLRRLSRTENGDPNVTERLALWGAAWNAFASHPVFGIGYGQFPSYASGVHDLVHKVTHETYLSYGAEVGVPGLVAFLWLYGAVVRDSRRLIRSLESRIPRVLFGFLVATAVQALVTNVDQFRSLWITIGMVAALELRMRRARPPTPTPSHRHSMVGAPP